MRKRILVIILALSVTMGVSSNVSEAYLPLAYELAEAFTGALSVGMGASYGSSESAKFAAEQLISTMDDAEGAQMEQYIDDWEYGDKITVSEDFYLAMQSKLTLLSTQNSVMMNMIGKKIIPYTYNSCTMIYVAPGSTVASGSTSLKSMLNMYQLPVPGIFFVTDTLAIRTSLVLSNSRIRLDMDEYNLDGSLKITKNLSTDYYLPIGGVRTGFSINGTSGKVSVYVKGYDYTTTNLVERVLTPDLYISDALKLDIINYINGHSNAMTYTVYDPSIDSRGNVVIPVPYNYPIADLPGVLPGDIYNGVDVPPVEGGADYTGILGAISSAIGAIKTWTDTWNNPDASTWSLDFSPLQVNLFDRFPFCLPFDFMHLVSVFSAAPSDYVLSVDLDTSFLKLNHTVDMSPFMLAIRFFRYAVVAWFIYILISKTRDLIKW